MRLIRKVYIYVHGKMGRKSAEQLQKSQRVKVSNAQQTFLSMEKEPVKHIDTM